MTWIIVEFKRGLAQLRRWQTWAAIALFGFIGVLAYQVGRMALWTDSTLTYLRVSTRPCRQLTNGMIIGLFFGMIFLLFFAVLSMGEIQRYIQLSQRGATYQARRALALGVGWGALAVAIAVAGLYFFSTTCH
ncbi:MAG: hypothetical protein LBE81_05965 [Azonexus sp.]|jgi:hypothetical protein|uniref:hypothetical protein n=1 Tax=Azonexus sp. TaxID=1872668 RepID=UPI00282CD967|nr:hypothetical protein [Azonexus sp.]MDR0776168.1 hypothetical protein [Azonexus sp.]